VRLTATRTSLRLLWLPGDSDGDVGKSADAGPLPRCTLYALQVPADRFGSQNAEGDPEGAKPDGSARCAATAMRCGERTQQRLVPLASLRSARVLTGLYSAFANPVLERLGYGMANMRLISRDAGPIATTVSLLL
jgi:hypothetical protein